MPRSRRQPDRTPVGPRPPSADELPAERFEVRVDHDAPPGDVLGALARLLLARARRQLQQEKGNGVKK